MKGRKRPGVGRPLFDGKPEDAVLPLLRQAWALDATDTEAASLAGISPAALSRYLESHPLISEEKAALKEKPFLMARQAMLKQINGGDGDLAMRYMERKKRREFATLSQVETSEASPYKELTDEQLALIAQGKATPADFKEKKR